MAAESKSKTKVLSIVFSPAYNDSFIYLGVLKALNDQKINYSVVGLSNFTSLVLNLYFISEKNNLGFEWLAYKFKKNLDNYLIFSSDWIEEVDQFIEDNFAQAKRSEIDKVLVFKIDKSNNKNSEYDSTSSLNLVLRQSIRPLYIDKKSKAIDYKNGVYSSKSLLKYGVDKILWIDIENSLSKISKNKILIDTYRMMRSKIDQDKLSADINFDLKSDFKLDQIGNLGRKIKSGYSQTIEWLKINKELLK